MNKFERMITLTAGVAGIAAAIYTLKKPAVAAVSVPPASTRYNAASNPNGYVWVNGRGWVKTAQNGAYQSWEDEMFSTWGDQEIFTDGVS